MGKVATAYGTPTAFSARREEISLDAPSNGWQFYMRELYASATPVKPLTFELGSFGVERGRSTEITTFDEDGYLTGERLRLRDPKHFE